MCHTPMRMRNFITGTGTAGCVRMRTFPVRTNPLIQRKSDPIHFQTDRLMPNTARRALLCKRSQMYRVSQKGRRQTITSPNVDHF